MASHSHPLGDRLVVGITGRIGSGKTTVGKYLESRYGFQYLRYSAVIASWMGLDPDNKRHLRKIGWEIMARGMQAELNHRLMEEMARNQDSAVDGLRHLLDFDTLSKSFRRSFHLLFIESAPLLRFERLRAKGKYEDYASFNSADVHPVEQQIDLLRERASYQIGNEASLESLYATIDRSVSDFRRGGQS